MKLRHYLESNEMALQSHCGQSRCSTSNKGIKYRLILLSSEVDKKLYEFNWLLRLVDSLFGLLETKLQDVGRVRALSLTLADVHSSYTML